MANTTCIGPDCDRGGRIRRGLCEPHYKQWIRNGKSFDQLQPLIERDLRPYKVRLLARYSDDAASGCWNWTGSMTWGGYGQIGREGTNVTAHRAMWEFHRGPIPAGVALDHLCQNRRCVNPDHLEIVTYSENNFRRFHGTDWIPTPV